MRTQTRMEAYGHGQQHPGKLLRLSASPHSRMYTTSPPEQSPSKSLESDGSHQEEAPEQFWSFDDFADTITEEAKAKAKNQGLEPASSISGPQKPVFTHIRLLLLHLFKRTLKYGLLPEVTAFPDAVGPDHGTPCWEVTIALKELGISVSGHGSRRILAEVAASIKFELLLSSPETVAKLERFPRAEINPENAIDIIRAYCSTISRSLDDLRRDVTRTSSSEAYEARMFLKDMQIGKPAVSAVKDLAKSISPLTLAHGVLNGDPDVWPAGVENSFQPKIVVGDAGMTMLQKLIKAAENYLLTIPGVPPRANQDGSSQGSYLKTDHNNDEGQGASQDTTARQSSDLDSFFSSLPFPPSTAKMLVLGASVRCLEPVIILAALGRHDIYRQLAPGEKYQGDHLDPYLKNTIHGDHSDLVLLYQRLRKESQNIPEGDEASKAAERFANFDTNGIRSVSAAARDIERILKSASLINSSDEDSDIGLTGTELQVRQQPYGYGLNVNSTKMFAVRHLMAVGFGHNIAQYGYGSLLPGGLPELRVGSQKVHIGSPLRSHLTTKQLKKVMDNSPLVVLSGTSEQPEGRGLSAQYSSPISTWQAVLLGEEVLPAEETEVPLDPGAAQLVLNGWLPVLVKSEVLGVSDQDVRKLILDAREVLQQAMRKAMHDYIKHSWTSIAFYQLLREIPIEMNTEAMKQKSAKGQGQDTTKGESQDTVTG